MSRRHRLLAHPTRQTRPSDINRKPTSYPPLPPKPPQFTVVEELSVEEEAQFKSLGRWWLRGGKLPENWRDFEGPLPVPPRPVRLTKAELRSRSFIRARSKAHSGEGVGADKGEDEEVGGNERRHGAPGDPHPPSEEALPLKEPGV